MSIQRECPFCDFVAKRGESALEVYRDDHVVAFFPDHPAVLGHTLIVPRRHVANIWELDYETTVRIARTTTLLAHAIRSAVQPAGLNVIQSNGEAATQTVFHLHVHLVPRTPGDAMGPIWPFSDPEYSDAQKGATLKSIQSSMPRQSAWGES